ncbi:MAG: OmpA family protein [Myxococcales bacterium]|nr:OmpA family protein [Myxococcales bacterium]
MLMASFGCVGLGTHNEVVTERDRLAERVRLLEASNDALSAERVALADQLEDLRIEREQLEVDVADLRQQRESLSTNLSAREAELAKQNQEVERLRGTYEALVSDLEKELAAGQIQIRQLAEGLEVNVAEDILFPSGSAALSTGGRTVLRKVATELAKLPHEIEVDGHTDDVPIRGTLAARYPSNWELASARASSVVRLFQEAGIAGTRLIAVSHAEFKPVAPNDSPANRALNRRIEIRLRPQGRAQGSAEPTAAE